MVDFVRVSVIGADPITHITIPRSTYRSNKHRLLKADPLDRNGKPRPAKFSPKESDSGEAPELEAAPADTTTGQEATS